MVSSTASSLIVLFIIFTSFKLASLTRYIHFEICVQNECDIFAPQMRYYLAMRDSDIFAFGECGVKHANINPRDLAHAVRSRAEGTYRAAGISHANEMQRISQIP